jgi:cytochrome c556
LKFLDHLIDKYFIWISNKKDVDAVRKIDNSILETAKKCSDLLKRVEKHLTHLAGLMEDPFKYDSHQFRTEHQQLEDEITNFVKVFRNNRKEVFEVTSLVVESDDFIRQFVVK